MISIHLNCPRNLISTLLEGERQLAETGFVLRPRRHAELLLEKTLGINRTELYLHARDVLPEDSIREYETLLMRRINGEPVQYITGWTSFFGYHLDVGTGVFIPRFDSEVLVEHLLQLIKLDDMTSKPIEILDLCCGTGALGLTAAAEAPDVSATLVDNSPIALEYTARNAHKLNLSNRIEIVSLDALADFPLEWHARFSYILANPPYIPYSEITDLHPDVRDNEPREALTDGSDGLTFYSRWATTLPLLAKPPGRIIVEIGDNALDRVKAILDGFCDGVETIFDLGNLPRALSGRIKR